MVRYALFIWPLFFYLSLAFGADWSSTNFQVLHGDNYQLGDPRRTIFTFEHASRWKYGENFYFFDATNPDQKETSIYGEFSPSLNFNKIFNKNFSNEWVQDYRLTANLELTQRKRVYLYGLGVNLNIPSFSFFKVNAYLRDNPLLDGNTYQLTVVWLKVFKFKQHQFQFTGFGDFAGTESSYARNELIVPQFLWDLGNFLHGSDGVSLVGVEYSYWRNKFGISHLQESVAQAMLKWYF